MLNPGRIFRHSSKLTLVGMIGTALNFPVSIIVANKLGPTVFGQVSFVLLWLTYSGLVHIGIFEGGQREIIHNLGRERSDRVRFYQNLSLTGELLWSALPATCLFAAAFFFSDPVRRIGFVLAPLAFVAAGLSRILAGYHFAHQRFGIYARLSLVRSTAQPILLLLLVFLIGPYALFVVPAFVEFCICGFYVWCAPSLGLGWNFNSSEAVRLIRAGLPLGLQALVYWAYRLTGLTSVAILLPAPQLGYYAFSARLIDFAIRPFSDFGAVLMPTLWTELGRVGNVRDVSSDAVRVSLLMTVAACAVANLLQAVFAPALQILAPRFVSSAAIFEILSFNIILLTIVYVPSLVLDSMVVNKRWAHLNIWIAGLTVNLVANVFVLHRGLGLLAVAWNDIWIQFVVIVAVFGVTHRHLFISGAQAWRFYFSEIALLCVCVGVFVFLRWLSVEAEGVAAGVVLRALGARVLIAAAVWMTIGFSFYLYHRQTYSKKIVESLVG